MNSPMPCAVAADLHRHLAAEARESAMSDAAAVLIEEWRSDEKKVAEFDNTDAIDALVWAALNGDNDAMLAAQDKCRDAFAAHYAAEARAKVEADTEVEA